MKPILSRAPLFFFLNDKMILEATPTESKALMTAPTCYARAIPIHNSFYTCHVT